jgi:hypothetical protein
MSQEAVVEKAGISRDANGLLVRGARRSPRRDALALLARALNLPDHERERLRTAASDLGPLPEASREERLAAVRAALSPDAFEAAWAEGEAMTLEEAVTLAFAN